MGWGTILERWRRPARAAQDPEHWADAISRYLGVPRDEVARAVEGTPEDKRRFVDMYDGGRRILTTLNRAAEETGVLSRSWGELKYVAVKQEWLGFRRFGLIRDSVLPRVDACVARSNPGGRDVRVLDYGCGTSLFGRVLLNRHPDWALWLCDVDGYHLRFALAECLRLNPGTQACVASPGVAVPAFPAALDVVHAFACFEHIPNVYDVLCGLWAALKPGGHLLETFAGETGCEPPADSSDAASAWAQRDACFTFLLQNGALVDGSLPPLTAGGHYAEDEQLRVWRKRLP